MRSTEPGISAPFVGTFPARGRERRNGNGGQKPSVRRLHGLGCQADVLKETPMMQHRWLLPWIMVVLVIHIKIIRRKR